MADGDIAAAVTDTLAWEAGPNVVGSTRIAHATGDIYAIVYAHWNSGSGVLVTVDVDSDGNIGAAVEDTFEFESGRCIRPDIIKIADGVVAVVYRGVDEDGFVKTIGVQSDGTITGTVDTLEFDATEAYDPAIINVSGDIWAIAYEQSTVRQGMVATVDIDSAGNIGAAVIDTLVFDGSMGFEPRIVNVTGDIFAIAYTGPGSDGWLATCEIDSSGNIGAAVIDTLEFDTATGLDCSIVQPVDGFVAIAYTGVDNDGFLVTVGIDASGNIDAAVTASLEFDALDGRFPWIFDVGSDGVIGIYYFQEPAGTNSRVSTYTISAAGAISAQIDSLQVGASTDSSHSVRYIAESQIYILCRETGSNGGSVETVDIETTVVSDGLVVSMCALDILDKVLGITVERGRDDELADTGTGTALLTLDNNEGDFSPENTGGDYYPTLDLGCAVVIQQIVGGVTYNVFKGTIDKIIPKDAPDVVGRTADMTVLDGMDDMAGTEISIAKLTGTSADALIDDALDEIGWAAAPGGRTLDAGVDVFEQGWAHRESALEFILDVAKQDGGFFYVDTDGKAIFENRHHRIQGAHLTSRHDFGTAIQDVQYEFSKRFLFNKARVTGKAYVVDGVDSFLWSAKTGNNQEAPYVGPGDTVTIIAELPLGLDSFTSLGAGGTYWNANSVADKSGTDLTSDFSINTTQKGQQLELAITNAGSIGGYLVEPDTLPGSPVPDDLTGQTLLVVGKLLQELEMAFVVEDGTSQTAYKTRSWELDARFQSRPQQMIAYANHIITRFKDPVPTPVSFTIKAEVDATNRQWALDLKLSDRCTVASTRLGFDRDYYVNKIIHQYEIRGSQFSHWVTFVIERTAGAAEGVAWLLGEAGFGELGETTFLVW